MRNDCTQCVKSLISFGAVISIRDINNYTPLHISILEGSGQSLEMLLQIGSDPNEEWMKKLTPLHLASEIGNLVFIFFTLNRKSFPLLCYI